MPQKLKAAAAILLLILLLPGLNALAAEGKTAQDVTDQCTLTASVHQDTTFLMKIRQLKRCWNGGRKGTLEVKLPGKEKAQGVMLAFHTRVPRLVIESLDGKKPVKIAEYRERYYNNYIPFSQPAHTFRIRAAEDNEKNIRISRMNVMTEGKLPDWVQRWSDMEDGQADILLVATHPDDDILWFGGLLPTYAGQKKMKVMVAYAKIGPRYLRRNELLDALWHCGVRLYPAMPGGMQAEDYVEYVVRCIRRYQPTVVVTQDVNGEYGHKDHLKLVKAVIQAVKTDCLKKTVSPKSAKQYGVYQPKKLYVHLWKENQSIFNWEKPLSAFGGKTGLRLAREAFKMHESQQNGRHAVLANGKYDCRKLGLYWSSVGKDDTKKPDLMQHVTPKK